MGDVHGSSSLNLSVEKTVDKELILSIVSHPEIIDGFCSKDKNAEKYVEGLGEIHTCYVAICNSEIAGIAMFLHANDDTLNTNIVVVDIGFYKKYRGSVAVSLSKMGLNKFINENDCDQLIAPIKEDNKAALINAKWLGFEIFSNNKSINYLRYKKDGRSYRRLQRC